MAISRLLALPLVFALMVGSGPVHAADPSPAAQDWLEPNGNWTVDYGKAECRLLRGFGASDRLLALEIARGLERDSYRWGLYGLDVPAYSGEVALTLNLAPQGTSHSIDATPYALNGRPEHVVKWTDADRSLTDAVRNDQRLHVTDGKKLDVRLRLSGMKAAIKALEKCQVDLLASWGVDPAIPVKPEPVGNPGRWVTNEDYPSAEMAAEHEGMITFLIDVSVAGKVAQCRIVGSSGWPALDSRTCELMRRRAVFRPARDAAGNPVAGHYINRVWWQIPR